MASAAAHTQERAVLMLSVSHPDVLAQLFQRLPVGDQCFTITLISKQWQWAVSKQVELKAEAERWDENSILGSHPVYHLPLWWVKREWPGLAEGQEHQVMNWAAYLGNTATLGFTRCTGSALSVDSTWTAAAGGQLEALQWAWANGGYRGVGVCSFAAHTGQLPVLQ